MSTHPIPDLMQLWRKGELTAEQTVGYILQNLLGFFHRLADLEKRVRKVEQTLDKPPA